MEFSQAPQLEIPVALRDKLVAFRSRVWKVKMTEAVGGAVAGVLLGFLLVYLSDRWMETPRLVRWAIFSGAVVACTAIPLALERWVWRHRRLEQLARLLGCKHPGIGDQLLGIIELTQNPAEQARSLRLCQAAVQQVSAAAEKRDFTDAIPPSWHRGALTAAATFAVCSVGLLLGTTQAATNAWSRFLAPWANIARYTFVSIKPLPDVVVVPHGEVSPFQVTLAENSVRKPTTARMDRLGQPELAAVFKDGTYQFDLPAQLQTNTYHLSVGDYSRSLAIEPKARPELQSLSAKITLPGYLERTETLAKDVRGGVLSVVRGSTVELKATASRALASAAVNGVPTIPSGSEIQSTPLLVDLAAPIAGAAPGKAEELLTEEEAARGTSSESSTSIEEPVASRVVKFEWQDEFGLSAKTPFQLTLTGTLDNPPSLVCENMPRQRIVLDSEVLTFQVRARDDFGVKRVGLEWEAISPDAKGSRARGERIIGAGSSEAELLDLTATFSATSFGIEPQTIRLRAFAEDYLPGRERVYSSASQLDILTADEHALWVMAQLARWQKQSLEVRDREMQLHEANKEIRELDEDQLDRADVRKRIENQAAAERANGRRLSGLTKSGEELLRQAMRNPEIGVGHLDKWADMLQTLKDISGNRMPSVADLLKQAANSPQMAQNSPSQKRPGAGNNRNTMIGTADNKKPGEPQPPKPVVPALVDVESSMNQPKPDEPGPPKEGKPSNPSFKLPSTMLAGNGKPKPEGEKPPVAAKVDEAVQEQQELLAEFEKLSDELNKVLANLEGSTLVKRLKATARLEGKIANRLGNVASTTFGADDRVKQTQSQEFGELAQNQQKGGHEISNIMDDMHAYFERSRFMRFKVVLDDMRKQDVSGGLRQLGDDLKKENGLSIAQAEYWADTLDRWAEDLVEVTKCGACSGCKSKGFLPPSIVLEVLQILEGEVNLREETRVAEQARAGVEAKVHQETTKQLSETQYGLRKRIDKVILRILELPDAESDFGRDLGILRKVSPVMTEATGILAAGDSGSPAIAAETEAIELLLQSKRFNPKGGGGGGSTPGGGGGGTTNDTALALVGTGVNEKEVRQDHGVGQAQGVSGTPLPEEFRAGLDEYFNRLEGKPAAK